jgi:hypothetical protein
LAETRGTEELEMLKLQAEIAGINPGTESIELISRQSRTTRSNGKPTNRGRRILANRQELDAGSAANLSLLQSGFGQAVCRD